QIRIRYVNTIDFHFCTTRFYECSVSTNRKCIPCCKDRIQLTLWISSQKHCYRILRIDRSISASYSETFKLYDAWISRQYFLIYFVAAYHGWETINPKIKNVSLAACFFKQMIKCKCS